MSVAWWAVVLSLLLVLNSCLVHPILAQLDQTVYYIYKEGSITPSSCPETPALAVDGQVLGDFFSQQNVPLTENATCLTHLTCLWDASSQQCQALTDGVVDTTQLSINVQQNGDLIECNSRNVALGRELCTINPPDCAPSDSFRACTRTLVTGPELVNNPRVLLYDKTQYPSNISDVTVYLMYYTDAECTDFAALKGILQDANNTFPIVNTSSNSCEQTLSCLLNPNGSTCSALPQTGLSTTISYEIVAGQPLVCYHDSETDESDCIPVPDLSTCRPSTIFRGCYTTEVLASELLTNPPFYITPPKPVSYPLNATYYAIFYDTEGRCSGSAIAAEGGVVGDSISLQRAESVNRNCAAELSCLLDPFSNECFFVTRGLIQTSTIRVNYTNDGSLLVCVASGQDLGQTTCSVNPPLCGHNDFYPSCTDSILTGPELVAVPNSLQNIQPPEETERSAYLIFYNDETCLDFAAMRGVVLDTYNFFPRIDDLPMYTCQDKMVCLLNPQGKACQSLLQTQHGNMVYLTTDGVDERGNPKLTVCQVDEEEEKCTPVENDEFCATSPMYPGCYARVVWGPYLLANPIRYLTPPTNAPTGTPSGEPSSLPSSVPTMMPTNGRTSEPASIGTASQTSKAAFLNVFVVVGTIHSVYSMLSVL